MKFQQNFCVVDSSLRLLWVGGDWDDFALSNGGAACIANSVLSTPLTAHITDVRTADAVADMVRAVLDLQRLLKFEYRCDSPAEIRRFRMTIQPMKDGRALMVHDLRDAEMIPVPLVPWRFDPTADALKCSMCCSVSVGSDWVDPVELGPDHPSDVAFTLCPACGGRIDHAIAATQSGTDSAGMQDVLPDSGFAQD